MAKINQRRPKPAKHAFADGRSNFSPKNTFYIYQHHDTTSEPNNFILNSFGELVLLIYCFCCVFCFGRFCFTLRLFFLIYIILSCLRCHFCTLISWCFLSCRRDLYTKISRDYSVTGK